MVRATKRTIEEMVVKSQHSTEKAAGRDTVAAREPEATTETRLIIQKTRHDGGRRTTRTSQGCGGSKRTNQGDDTARHYGASVDRKRFEKRRMKEETTSKTETRETTNTRGKVTVEQWREWSQKESRATRKPNGVPPQKSGSGGAAWEHKKSKVVFITWELRHGATSRQTRWCMHIGGSSKQCNIWCGACKASGMTDKMT